MPNQIPYGFYNLNSGNIPNYDNFDDNIYNMNKLRELEQRIKLLENEIFKLKNNKISNNSDDTYSYKYDYKTSMHMM